MKKWLFTIVFFTLSLGLMGQQWIIQLEEERNSWLNDLIYVDAGENVVGIGTHNIASSPCKDGVILKVDKEGNIMSRVVHLPGKTLEYYSAVQLPNGNFMVFGVCDDSLSDYNFQKYIRIDVFDEQLDTVLSQTYCVDDEIFDQFSYPHEGVIMNSIVTHSGTVILATRLSHFVETWNFYAPALRLYELDETGLILRMHDTPLLQIGSINEITYIPDTDNLMILLDGGVFGYNSGVVGWYVVDPELNIIDRQMLTYLNGENLSDVACDGHWIDGQYLIVDGEQYEGSHFTYHTLFKMDTLMNVTATLQLPPYDSCTWVPWGTNTAYANDSTIFAVSYCSESMFSEVVYQTNIILVDKDLNLLGRKVLKEDNVLKQVSSPAVFNDGGCLVMVYSYNGSQYSGEPFARYELMKFRREDIEITWDIVNETEAKPTSVAYPNPTANSINIPIDETLLSHEARIQIFDAKGMKCLDSEIGGTGNLITLDVHNLDAGMYVYKVVSGNHELASGKFVKE